MAVNGSAASGRFVGAELVIDPIGTVFEPLEHSPAPFRSHLVSGECIGVAVSVNAGAALVYSARTLDAFDAASNA
jgi:hypothetical protein